MLKTETVPISIANMLLGVCISSLLMLEFDLTWKAGVAFYIIAFNFMRIVGTVVNHD